MPKQLHTMTKIAGANAIIVPFVFFQEEYNAYTSTYGTERTSVMDFIPLMYRCSESDSTCSNHFTPRLYALEKASIAHLGLWGTSFALNNLGMTHGFKILFAPVAALWIEHIISNLNWVVTFYVTYLFYSADFGILMTLAYFIQGIIMW